MRVDRDRATNNTATTPPPQHAHSKQRNWSVSNVAVRPSRQYSRSPKLASATVSSPPPMLNEVVELQVGVKNDT